MRLMGIMTVKMRLRIILLMILMLYQTKSHVLINTGLSINDKVNTHIYETHVIVPISIKKPSLILPETDVIQRIAYSLNISNLECRLKVNDLTKMFELVNSQKKWNSRIKRGLWAAIAPAMGWIITKIPDLYDVYLKYQQGKQLASIKDVVEDLSANLKNTNNALRMLITQVRNLDTHYRSTTGALSESIKSLIFRLQSLSFDVILFHSFQLSQNYHLREVIRYDSFYSSCQSGFIHPDLIHKDILIEFINHAMMSISSNNYQLSIPLSKINWYYKYKLAYCEENDNDLMLLLSIPIVSYQFNNYEIKSLDIIPIRMLGINYALNIPTTHLIFEGRNDTLMVTESLNECISESLNDEDFCLIKPIVIQPIQDNPCLNTIWEGNTIQEYKKYCDLYELPDSTHHLKKLNRTTWCYSGVVQDIIMKCGLSTNKFTIGGENVNTLITAQCGCHVELNNHLLFSGLSGCHPVYETININSFSAFIVPYDHLLLTDKQVISDSELSIDIPVDLSLIDKYLTDEKSTVNYIKSSRQSSHTIYLIIGVSLIFSVLVILILFKVGLHYWSPFSVLPTVEAFQTHFIELGIDFFFVMIIIVLLLILIINQRKLLRRFKCHSFKVSSLDAYEPHFDLIIHTQPTVTIVGLCPNPGGYGTYNTCGCEGRALISNKKLIVMDIPSIQGIEDVINVNGTYNVQTHIIIPETKCTIRVALL